VSLSHEVNPEWREYERTASTVANAISARRFRAICARWRSCRCDASRAPRADDESDGGAASARKLTRTPIQTVMSGRSRRDRRRHLGDVKGIANLITFDTGAPAPTWRCCGRAAVQSEVSVAAPSAAHAHHRPAIAPAAAARPVQLGHVLKVGPQAPAPIPVCLYGRGGRSRRSPMRGAARPSQIRLRCSTARCRSTARRRAAAVSRAWPSPLCISPIEAGLGHPCALLATNVMVAMRTITVEARLRSARVHLGAVRRMGPTSPG